MALNKRIMQRSSDYFMDAQAIARVLDQKDPASAEEWALWQRAYCSALLIRSLEKQEVERVVQSFLNGFSLMNERLKVTRVVLPYAVILARDLGRIQLVDLGASRIDCNAATSLFAKLMGLTQQSDAVVAFERTCSVSALANWIKFDASAKLSKKSFTSFFFQDTLYDSDSFILPERALARMRSQMERWTRKTAKGASEEAPVVTGVEMMAEPVVRALDAAAGVVSVLALEAPGPALRMGSEFIQGPAVQSAVPMSSSVATISSSALPMSSSAIPMSSSALPMQSSAGIIQSSGGIIQSSALPMSSSAFQVQGAKDRKTSSVPMFLPAPAPVVSSVPLGSFAYLHLESAPLRERPIVIEEKQYKIFSVPPLGDCFFLALANNLMLMRRDLFTPTSPALQQLVSDPLMQRANIAALTGAEQDRLAAKIRRDLFHYMANSGWLQRQVSHNLAFVLGADASDRERALLVEIANRANLEQTLDGLKELYLNKDFWANTILIKMAALAYSMNLLIFNQAMNKWMIITCSDYVMDVPSVDWKQQPLTMLYYKGQHYESMETVDGPRRTCWFPNLASAERQVGRVKITQ